MRTNLGPGRSRPARATAAVLSLALVSLSTACSFGGDDEEVDRSKQVVVATHDSWNMDEKVLEEFTDKTGYVVKVQPQGDAGQLANKLVLSKNSPIADMTYGIDNTFVSRVVDEGVLADYTPDESPGLKYEPQSDGAADQVTTVDFSDVCVNVDESWFADKQMPPPETFDDLTKKQYQDLFVTPGATTSSPGLAFLLATISRYGRGGWQDYWFKLINNGMKVTSGWSDAYQVDFTAGGGKGDRPIVLSYASSPPFTIPEGGDKPTTRALLDTCFRQAEYAAVLKGAENPEGAKAFVDFMIGKSFQQALPENMYVFPADESVKLPKEWAKYAKVSDHPWTLGDAEIADNRDDWLSAWGDLVS